MNDVALRANAALRANGIETVGLCVEIQLIFDKKCAINEVINKVILIAFYFYLAICKIMWYNKVNIYFNK